MFEDKFALDRRTAPPEDLAITTRPPKRARQPGVYSNGLIVLLGTSFSRDWMQHWPPLVGRAEPFAYTAFGNMFFWDVRKNVVQLLSAQEGVLDDVADSIDELLDGVLAKDDVIDAVLLRDFVGEIRRFHGPLRYGECYISVPWRMLGGGDDPKRYDRGAVDVYLSLVGQTHSDDFE